MRFKIKINKDIKDFTEQIFFGMSLRQLIFSITGIGASVLVYFMFVDALGNEVVSWLCILAALPSILLGFVRYNGMSAERLMVAVIKTHLTPQILKFKATTDAKELMND